MQAELTAECPENMWISQGTSAKPKNNMNFTFLSSPPALGCFCNPSLVNFKGQQRCITPVLHSSISASALQYLLGLIAAGLRLGL